MTEPIYEYIKGKGWTLEIPNIRVLACGTRVQLEFRPPKASETYTFFSRVYDSQYLTEDKNALNDAGWNWLTTRRFDAFAKSWSDKSPISSRFYVVITPI